MLATADGNGADCACPDCRAAQALPEMNVGRGRKRPQVKANTHLLRRSKAQQRRKVPDKTQLPLEVIPLNQKLPGAVSVNIFPVPRESETASALQYYAEVFACAIHPHHEDAPEAWHNANFWDTIIQPAMSDPMWFCANVAFCEAMKDRAVHDRFEKTDIIVKYQSKAFQDLRKRLIPEKDNDVLLLTITVLMSLDIAFGSRESFKTHSEGLERILQLRGGLESLNYSPYLKAKIIGFQKFFLTKQMAYATSVGRAEYPEFPYSSSLCAAIAKLPKELAELALSGKLNTALIRLTADVAVLQSKFAREGEKRPEDLRRIKLLGYEMEELLHLRGTSYIERLMAAALTDYTTVLDTDRDAHWLLGGAVRMNISPVWRNGVKWEKQYSKVLIWLGAVLACSSEINSMTWQLGTDILGRCAEHETLDRAHTLKTCREFIWDEEVMTPKLELKFDFECTPSTRAVSTFEKSPSPLERLPEVERAMAKVAVTP